MFYVLKMTTTMLIALWALIGVSKADRLDGSIVPSDYVIDIKVHLDTNDERAFSFDGMTKIIINPQINNISQIMLHSQGLDIYSNVSVLHEDGSSVNLNKENPIVLHDIKSLLIINLETPLIKAITYHIIIFYAGNLANDTNGFYRSSYIINKNKKWLATTQFQTIGARRAFPCFDELNFKAKFQLTITSQSKYNTILFNTKAERTFSLSDGWTRTIFQTTPIMSTYNLAFLISDYEAQYYEDFKGRQIAIWSQSDLKYSTGFAFDAAKKSVKLLSAFLEIDYYSMNSNLTFNHIAVPDFGAGATEFWGLIAYKVHFLTTNKTDSNLRSLQRSVTVISHETAHMWFGNLVTCNWWGDLWLNEGFAEYFGYYIGSLVEPSFGLKEHLAIDSVQLGLAADQQKGGKPLSNKNIDNLGGQFGTISYKKGSSFLQMIEHLIGVDSMKLAIQKYLLNSQFGLGYPEDLFKYLEEASGSRVLEEFSVNLTDISKSFSLQVGYPLITVSANFSSGVICFEQEQFFIESCEKSNEIFIVPISIATKREVPLSSKPKFILDKKRDIYNMGTGEKGWIVVNVNQTGFYRVNYEDKLWNLLKETLRSGQYDEIPVLSRSQIIDDVFALARADVVTYQRVFDIINYLRYETSWYVWVAAVRGLTYLKNRLENNKNDLQIFRNYVLNITNELIKLIGLHENADEDPIKKLLRITVLEFACVLEEEECVAYALFLFRELITKEMPVSRNVRTMVYCTALKYGTEEDFFSLWNKYKLTIYETEKQEILNTLGCTTRKNSLNFFLHEIFKIESFIKTQDIGSAFVSCMQVKSNVQYVFEFVMENQEAIKKTFSLSTTLTQIAANILTEYDLEQFEKLIKINSDLEDKSEIMAIEEAINNSKAIFKWTRSHIVDIRKALHAKY